MFGKSCGVDAVCALVPMGDILNTFCESCNFNCILLRLTKRYLLLSSKPPASIPKRIGATSALEAAVWCAVKVKACTYCFIMSLYHLRIAFLTMHSCVIPSDVL
ncbi:hypothetical protein AVEN_62717-1 [Araneus ventricosus]|uniref:Uncharacterized protein n=1 Tax=Araneus ventricosus TaxID=182803 RepID=A0A4Y2L0U0_ARAVE|nr:hypothetical protein AVEN_62717-1 [Araneus ventricosus]